MLNSALKWWSPVKLSPLEGSRNFVVKICVVSLFPPPLSKQAFAAPVTISHIYMYILGFRNVNVFT